VKIRPLPVIQSLSATTPAPVTTDTKSDAFSGDRQRSRGEEAEGEILITNSRLLASSFRRRPTARVRSFAAFLQSSSRSPARVASRRVACTSARMRTSGFFYDSRRLSARRKMPLRSISLGTLELLAQLRAGGATRVRTSSSSSSLTSSPSLTYLTSLKSASFPKGDRNFFRLRTRLEKGLDEWRRSAIRLIYDTFTTLPPTPPSPAPPTRVNIWSRGRRESRDAERGERREREIGIDGKKWSHKACPASEKSPRRRRPLSSRTSC